MHTIERTKIFYHVVLEISRLEYYTLVIYATLILVLFSQNQHAEHSEGAQWCAIYFYMKYGV